MRKLAMLAASFSFGVFLLVLCLPKEGWAFVGAGAALLLAGTPPALRGRPRLRRRAMWCLSGLLLSVVWVWAFDHLVLSPIRAVDDTTVRLQAEVLEWPVETDYGWSVLVKGAIPGTGGVTTLLYVDERGETLRPGDRVESVTHLRLSRRSAGGEWITYYTAKGIWLVGQTYGTLECSQGEYVSPLRWPALLSGTLKSGIRESFSDDTAPLVVALVTGNRESLSDPFTSSLQRTGLSHTVAVSGMHVAFLAGVLRLLLGRGRRAAAAVCVVVIFFALVVGCTPSVIRAVFMILLLELAPLLQRERDGFTSLSAALMLLLMQNPMAAAHVGLQLSFSAVAGIFLVGERLQAWMLRHLPECGAKRWRPGWWLGRLERFVVSTLSATLGASLFTTPLVALHFDTISLIAPLANLLTLWAVGFSFAGGLLVGMVGSVCLPLGRLVALPVEPLLRYLDGMIVVLARLPFSAVTVGCVYYAAWLVFVYLLLAGVTLTKGPKRPLLPLCASVIALCACMLLSAMSFQSGEMSIHILDVDQGQSVLIRTRDCTVLVDCGGGKYVEAGDVAADYLMNRGCFYLDLLILTHCHEDHANGVTQLLSRIQVGGILLPAWDDGSALRREILEAAERQEIPVWLVEREMTVEMARGGVRIFPALGEGETNEEGLSVLAWQGDFETLITGDMGAEQEEKLVKMFSLQPVDVLVAGHHGGRDATGETLLAACRPKVVVISVGEGNAYGHPSGETLRRLLEAGCDVYRTDRMGTVTIRAWAEE